MGNSLETTPTRDSRRRTTAVAILADIADTTWRMFVPVVGLLLVGRHFDNQTGFNPWLMLAGAALGSVIAGLLIKNQLSRGSK